MRKQHVADKKPIDDIRIQSFDLIDPVKTMTASLDSMTLISKRKQ